jgi:hypothetical protein
MAGRARPYELGAKNCVYTLDAMMRVAKVLVEDCSGCVVRVQSVIISQHVEAGPYTSPL